VTTPLAPPSDLLLSAAVLLPLLCALAGSLPGLRRVLQPLLPWTALPALAAVLLLPDGASAGFPWVLLHAKLGLDATGRLFLLFTSLLWLLSGVFGTGYLTADPRRARFFFFYGLAMSGNLGVIVAQDVVSFYVFFALMSFSAYGLVVHTGEPDAVRAGRVYLVLVVVGEVLVFAGLAVLAASCGSVDLVPLKQGAGGAPNGASVLLWLGFGIKAGALPLHVWLPLAHPAAPTPASAVLSGAMIKAGLLGWLRFLPMEAVSSPGWAAACVVAGLAAAFYGVAVGVAQSHPKTILAYSSVSQMGLITVGVGLSFMDPSLAAAALPAVALYAVHHGFAKGALFLGVGVLSATPAGTRGSRLAWAGMALAGLSLAGAPFTSGAVCKAALKTAVSLSPPDWQTALYILLPLASVGTTVLMGRLAFVLARRVPSVHKAPGTAMWAGWMGTLALVAFALFVLPTAERAVDLAAQAVRGALWPVAAGGVLTALGWAAARGRQGVSPPRVPSGDLLVVYAAVIRAPARLAAHIRAGAPRVVRPTRVLEGVRQQATAWVQSVESSLENGQVSGLLLLVFIVSLFLHLLLGA